MPTLRIPSAQHLARHWDKDPSRIARSLIRLHDNPPRFGYERLLAAAQDMILFRKTLPEIEKGLRGSTTYPPALKAYLEILPLISGHFLEAPPAFVQLIKPRSYPIGREHFIPFRPPFCYGRDGKIILPWMSFWRSNPVHGKKSSLFATIAQDIISQDPDLEDTDFQILDFSSKERGQSRSLSVERLSSIPKLSRAELSDMLSTFVTGYLLAKDYLDARGPAEHRSRKRPSAPPDHPDLFR